jgi:hypothetical protein
MTVPLTLGDIARRYGLQTWQVRRLYERRILPEPARVGSARVVHPDDLPKIEAALRQAGYLKPEVVA